MNKYEVVVKKVYVYTQQVMVDAYCVAEAERNAMALDACGRLEMTWNELTPKVQTSFTAQEV